MPKLDVLSPSFVMDASHAMDVAAAGGEPFSLRDDATLFGKPLSECSKADFARGVEAGQQQLDAADLRIARLRAELARIKGRL